MEKQQKNTQYKARRTIILIGAVLFISLFLMNFASAELKTYDSINKEVTIKSSFLGVPTGEIAKIKLNTPLVVKTGYGDVFKIAEIQITNLKDYNNAFQDIKFYNLKDKNKEIQRTIEYKVKSYETIQVEDYKKVCIDNVKNNSKDCKEELSGSHEEQKEVWLPLEKADFKKGEVVTIGLFTYVYEGDYVDWIPEYYGIKINEWASWSASLNSGLRSYYSFDDASGVVVRDNVTGRFNLSVTGSPTFRAGIRGTGLNFTGANGDYAITSNTYFTNDTNFSFSVWYKGFAPNPAYNALFSSRHSSDGSGFGLITIPPHINWNIRTKADFGVYSFPAFNDSTFHHYVVTYNYNTNNYSSYYDGVLINTTIYTTKNAVETDNKFWVGGTYAWASSSGSPKGTIDELGVWNRTITYAEVTSLYNGGLGVSYLEEDLTILAPQVTLNSPIDYFNTTIPTITFNATIRDYNIAGGIQNVTLFIDGVSDTFNTTGVNGTYIFSKVLSAGLHNWSILAYNKNSSANQSETRYINLTISSPTITISSPINYYNTTNPTINFNTIVSDNVRVENVSLYINNTLSETINLGCNFPFNCSYDFTKVLSDSYYYPWYILAYDNEGNPSQSTTRYFTIDNTPPIVNIEFPTNTTYYINYGNATITNFTKLYNWTSRDAFLNYCWYSVTNGVKNHTIVCDSNFTYSSPLQTTTFKAWANDTLNNLGFDFVTSTYKYKVYEINQSYTLTTIEGNEEDYYANVYLDSDFSISNLYFDYNGTNYSATYSTIGNYTRIEKTDFSVTGVTSDANNTLSWYLILNDGSVIKLQTKTQQVNNLLIGSCGTYNYKLFYVNLSDERTQNAINGTIETNVLIKSKDGLNYIYNWTTTITNTTTSLCSSTPLTSSVYYSVYGTIKYYASNENYSAMTEYYNFLNFSLNNNTQYTNITLFDLNTTEGTEFQLTFKDSDFRLRGDILIYVYREYIPEGVFKIVEVPKTDSNGQTILHLVRNDVVYNLIAVDSSGNILGTLTNVIAFCQDYTIGNCIINFQGTSTEEELEDFWADVGIRYTLDWDSTTNIVSLTFSSLTTELKNVRMEVVSSAVVTNRTLCNTSLSAITGVLTCDVSSIANTTASVNVKIFVDGVQKLQDSLTFDNSSHSTTALIFVGFLMLLAIGIFFMESKEGIIIGTILGFILLIGLGVLNGQIVETGVTTAVVWLIVVGIILLIKLNGEKQQ